MKIKKIIITALVILAVVGIGIKGRNLLKSRQAEVANEALPKTQTISVQVVKPKEGTLQKKEPYLAQVTSDKSIKLSTKLAGFVEKVFVEESDSVKKGQPLVQIDSVELRSNIDAIRSTLTAQKSDLALAKSIYERNKKLYEVGGLAKEKLDLSKVALNLKRSQINSTTQKLSQAKHQLSYLKITAPFDAEVDAILMHEGDLAAAGKPILSLSNGKKKLIFSYSPTMENKISKGKKIYANNKEIGAIRAIYTTSKNGLVTAEVELSKDINLPIGSSLNIEVLTDSKKGCIIPQNSILHKKDGEFVLEYVDNSFVQKEVEIVLTSKENILIKECPQNPLAKESEVKLAKLPAYRDVKIIGEDYE
jgi:RND family efflux transporter MFP subunit